VLALAVPVVGYGAAPALVALFAYGILPVIDITVAGLRSVPPAAIDAAAGMGFTAGGRLWRIELPLAAPLIVAGIRTSVAVAIGTATIGSTVGALTLGSPNAGQQDRGAAPIFRIGGDMPYRPPGL